MPKEADFAPPGHSACNTRSYVNEPISSARVGKRRQLDPAHGFNMGLQPLSAKTKRTKLVPRLSKTVLPPCHRRPFLSQVWTSGQNGIPACAKPALLRCSSTGHVPYKAIFAAYESLCMIYILTDALASQSNRSFSWLRLMCIVCQPMESQRGV